MEKLIEKEIAYVSKNGVYFAVSKFPEYGKLSKKKIDELQSGSRIQIDETKNDPLDFAMWKFSDNKPNMGKSMGKRKAGMAHRMFCNEYKVSREKILTFMVGGEI